MLRKKRENPESSDEHGGLAIHSVLKSSTVPRDDAMVFEEVLAMDCEGSSASVDDDGERPDYRYVAWLLRENLKDFVDGDQGEPPGSELQNLLNLATARKIISVDPKLLNPVLWRTLPKELLVLVLARLPLPDVTRLRCLSEDWNRDMATVNSKINQALGKTSPTVVASLSRREGSQLSPPEFFVTICTQMSSPYSYPLVPGDPIIREGGWHEVGAVDGGLACFASLRKPSKANPVCIVVVNLLTRVWRKLPPRQYEYLSPPQMMHIEVDSATKCYRVVVVVGKNLKGRPTAEIYDSDARQWTKATASLCSIFGLSHSWSYDDEYKCFNSADTTPCMYDFAAGQLKRCCDLMGPSQGDSVITYAVRKDCMFVLDRFRSDMLPAGDCCITKYRVQNNAKDWNAERLYMCSPFEDLLEDDILQMTLRPCEDYMMVFKDASSSGGRFWLLDLSTGDWSSLPDCFEVHMYGTFTLTKPSWNVVP